MSNSVLSMHDIVKSYQDGSETRTVLNNVNLEVRAGEFVAIVGPSGCGKSTLLNIAGVMLSPDSGSLSICGEDVSKLPRRAWTALRKEKIGFIFQSHQLLPYLKAGEQLMSLLGTSEEVARELFKELDIEGTFDQYPAHLSGGERQRVAIARAFATDAKLILADEPTASLDSRRGRRAVEMIQMEVHRRGKAAVMVTHDERVLDLVDKVYKMEDGTLREQR